LKLVWSGLAGLKFRERPTRSPILGDGVCVVVSDVDVVDFIAGGVHFGTKVRTGRFAVGVVLSTGLKLVLTGSDAFFAGSAVFLAGRVGLETGSAVFLTAGPNVIKLFLSVNYGFS